MNDNEISIPVWKATSEKGTEYYRGSKNGVEINGKTYRVSLFENTKKKSAKSPDMNIVLKEIKQVSEFDALNTKTEYDDIKSGVELKDSDLPF